jgi:2-C-methyl-D-erythritol 4-phosphate cytidylyltransferase/2-C-methyl-D-erythritol 2,4-cyclodiphosphate synthase
VVVAADCDSIARQALAGLDAVFVHGGATRAASVRAGLAAVTAVAGPDSAVLIHDAARPFLTGKTILELLAALEAVDAALPALPVADTLKRQEADGAVTVSREGLSRAQTPQAFRLGALTAAHAAWTGETEPTDDAAVFEAAGGRVALTPGDPMLMKLTYPEDFDMAERLAGGRTVTRIGQGFDAHTFGPGDHVTLCGVRIAHDHGLVGHSDADAGLHALTDALLGAIGEADIGEHFPPSDPQWRGASSDRFLVHAADLIRQQGGRIINVDVTLICEAPKVKPHRAVMRERIAALLGLPLTCVSVKATTTEGMGFTGRREGLAAQAIASVETPA